jgi:anti-sigma factor RsiW
MSMDHDPIDDELLSAWLDGEFAADPAEHARIEAWLREHPQDAERVRQWSEDRGALRALMAPTRDEALPQHLRALVLGETHVPPRRWLQAAMAAGLLVAGAALGALATWPSRAHDTADRELAAAGGWVQRAAFAHGVYVPEPRHAVEVKAQEEHLARWLTRRIDVPVKLFDLRAQGFDLVGGRLLPDGAGKSAQLMYQDAKGARITVYLRKPDEGTDAAFRYERQGELGLFYWVESGAGYALVGALPRERLLALAEAIYRQHPMPGAPVAAAASAAASAAR